MKKVASIKDSMTVDTNLVNPKVDREDSYKTLQEINIFLDHD